MQPSCLSEAKYLIEERRASTKSEYYRGELFAMAGASKAHNKVTAAVIGELYSHLKGKSCSVLSSDMRVYNKANSLYTYPDVVVTCGEEKYLDEELDTLLNPVIIIEVLSASTQDYDRGTKFMLYRSLESLQHYVLVSSLEYSIECYTRQAQQWILNTASNPEDEIYLEAIDYRFQLKDRYAQVTSFAD